MRIYTKFGDKGSTALLGGSVVSKNDLRVVAYGGIDELNAALGVVIAESDNLEIVDFLRKIQSDLFVIGAELSSKGMKSKPISPARVGDLENEIDRIDPILMPLRNFVLPGGCKTASLLHLARTICRRAERDVVALSQKESVNPDIIMYINRLSDLLFMQARLANHGEKVEEIIWKGH